MTEFSPSTCYHLTDDLADHAMSFAADAKQLPSKARRLFTPLGWGLQAG
jgi:hypothetical protein